MGLPKIGWFLFEKIPSFKMDDEWGYPYDLGTPTLWMTAHEIHRIMSVISWWASLVQVNAHDLLDKVTIWRGKKHYSLIPTEVCVIPICRRIKFNLRANTVFWDQLPVPSDQTVCFFFKLLHGCDQPLGLSLKPTTFATSSVPMACPQRLVKKLHPSRGRCATRGRLLL